MIMSDVVMGFVMKVLWQDHTFVKKKCYLYIFTS